MLLAKADPTLKTDLGDTAFQLISNHSFDDGSIYKELIELMSPNISQNSNSPTQPSTQKVSTIFTISFFKNFNFIF